MKKRFVLAAIVCVSIAGQANAAGKPAKAPADSAPGGRVSVVLANDARLPVVPQKTIEQALTIAANWIEGWYNKRIRFEISKTVAVDSYMLSYFNNLPLPANWLKFPYALNGSDTVMRFLKAQTQIVRDQPIDVLRSYVPDAMKPMMTSYDAAAFNLLMFYDAKVRLWRSLRTPAGTPYFDTTFSARHSYWYWERAFGSVWSDSITDNLVITNIMFIDDSLGDAPPHSLLRGGLLNGMADEECAQTIVSTFPMYTILPAVSDLQDTWERAASDTDRLLALSHIIAHEFGAHIIQGYKDVYDHKACLAVPTSGLAYRKTIQQLFDGPPCKLDHPMLDRRKFMADRYDNLAHRYININNYPMAYEAVRRAIEMDPDRPLLNRLLRQLEKKK